LNDPWQLEVLALMIETVVLGKGLARDFPGKGKSDLNLSFTRTPDEARAAVEEKAAAVLLIGPEISVDAAVALIEEIRRNRSQLAGVLVTNEMSTEVLQKALRGGLRDVAANTGQEILSAVLRAGETALTGRGQAARTGQAQPGRVITFFSTKGGVGKTVFAVNTAVGLARQDRGRVLLLDFDNQFGDVGVMLGLKPERTIADVIQAIDRLDEEMLKGFLTKHSSGVQALLAPVQREIAERISQAELKKILSAARLAGDFIIVDTPASFAENTLTILDNSDCICLVTTLDVPSVKNTQIALQTLELLNYGEDKIKVLLNRADSKVSLLPSEVEKHLKHEIAVEIPSNLAVPRSVNEGTPLLMEESRSALAAALNKIMELVVSAAPANQTIEISR
jgi:pilus assembly protein CpaE